ncbi:MAG: YcxB family protein [Oscillospiraceae bacterium]|nr:YcxB family protein [Oscillospiraceae bacterium]
MSKNENREECTPVYSTRFVFDKELYNDFCLASYNRAKKVFLFFLVMSAWLIWINLLGGNYTLVLWFAPTICFISCLIYFRTKQAIRVGFERMVLTGGKEIDVRYAFYEDKIVAHSDGSARDIFYEQVTKLFETKRFLLLYLKHDVYVTVEKSGLDASIEAVKAFFVRKCTLVKKKKFIDCSGDMKWSLVFLVALIVVATVGAVFAWILNGGSILKQI